MATIGAIRMANALMLEPLLGTGQSSSASSHKADKAKPCGALLQSIENVLEHTLAGVSKIDQTMVEVKINAVLIFT